MSLLALSSPLSSALHSTSLGRSRFTENGLAVHSVTRSTKVISARPMKVVSESNDSSQKEKTVSGRRELILKSSSVALLASVFHFSGTRPSYIGVQRTPPSLALCPPTPNCLSTSEEFNDLSHYAPPWTYNPQDGRGYKNPASQSQALEELYEVVTSTKPDGFIPTVIKKTDDYLYVEYESPLMGYVDDVEFWFPPGDRSLVEYRSASRLGESDLDINRKRIKFIRQALEKKGWESIGF